MQPASADQKTTARQRAEEYVKINGVMNRFPDQRTPSQEEIEKMEALVIKEMTEWYLKEQGLGV